MIAEDTCFQKAFSLFIFVLFVPFGVNFPAESNTCRNENEICQRLSQCQWLEAFPDYPLERLEKCYISKYAVCCPQATLHKKTPTENVAKPYIEDCKKWQQEIYPICPPEGLIVAGKKAQPKEFPHMALIGRKTRGTYSWECGGSLISQRYVLTAAHCFDSPEEITPNLVRLGELDYSRDNDDAMIQEFDMKDYTTHPNYEPDDDHDDIAIIELNGIAQLNKYVVPICLPITNGNENERFYAAGWGHVGTAREKSPHLQKVILDRFDDQTCQAKIDKKLSSSQICAGSFTDNRDTCQGDSGGPLFIEHPDIACMFFVHGITSFGYACGLGNIPGIYTRVYQYVDWIEVIVWNKTMGRN